MISSWETNEGEKRWDTEGDMGGFHSHGGTPLSLVYKGKSQWNIDDLGAYWFFYGGLDGVQLFSYSSCRISVSKTDPFYVLKLKHAMCVFWS